MEIHQFVHNLKSGSSEKRYKIPIVDSKNNTRGYLTPITDKSLDETQVILKLTQWRRENSQYFQTRFDPTPERTKNWLKNVVLPNDKVILFLVYYNDELVGHYGFKDITEGVASADNLLIGETKIRGPVSLLTMKAMLQWGFNELKLNEITATVLKSNQAALLVNKRLHFREVRSVPLIAKTSNTGEISLVEMPSAENYDDMNVYISLKKEDFKCRK